MTLKRRFYDQDATVNRAIELMFVFPEAFQEVIANGITMIADRECHAHELMNNVKSMGSEKILALYKSKQKKRRYDENIPVHTAINHLLIITPQNRVIVAKKVIELVGVIQEYFDSRAVIPALPEVADVERLVDIYVQLGPDESRLLLEKISQEFIAGLSECQEIHLLKPGSYEQVAEMDSGLRITNTTPDKPGHWAK